MASWSHKKFRHKKKASAKNIASTAVAPKSSVVSLSCRSARDTPDRRRESAFTPRGGAQADFTVVANRILALSSSGSVLVRLVNVRLETGQLKSIFGFF